MTRDHDQVVLDNVVAINATAKALLCRIPITDGPPRHDPFRDVWVPQSQITDDSEVYATGDEGQLVVKLWWAEREGLA